MAVQALFYFQKAEEMQDAWTSKRPLLSGTQGFWYCDLLMGGYDSASPPVNPLPESDLSRRQRLSCYREVRKGAAKTLEWFEDQYSILDIALDQLTLGRSYLLETFLEAPSGSLCALFKHH